MKKCFSRQENLNVLEEIIFKHEYDEDTDLIIRTGISYNPITIFVPIIILLLIL